MQEGGFFCFLLALETPKLITLFFIWWGGGGGEFRENPHRKPLSLLMKSVWNFRGRHSAWGFQNTYSWRSLPGFISTPHVTCAPGSRLQTRQGDWHRVQWPSGGPGNTLFILRASCPGGRFKHASTLLLLKGTGPQEVHPAPQHTEIQGGRVYLRAAIFYHDFILI